EKPDGTVVQTQISKMANGIVDDVEIAGVYAEEADAVATASIIVYDTTTNVLLEDGKDMELGGEVKKYWKVTLEHEDASGTNVDISDYNSATAGEDGGTVLDNVTIEYRHQIELAVGESLDFPSTYKVQFVGYRTSDFVESPCSGAGEGNIKVEREGKERGRLSFTGDDGQRYNGVYIDQGGVDGFSRGDMFVAGGLVYEYDDATEPTNEPSTMRVTLKDLLNGGKQEYDLAAVTSASATLTMKTFPFEDSTGNTEDITINPDENANDSDVFVGEGPADTYMLFSGGQTWLVYDQSDPTNPVTPANAMTVLEGEKIGIDQYIFGDSGASLQKFELDDSDLYMSVFNDNGTQQTVPQRNPANMDDRLVVFKNDQLEYLVIDFYDREFNDSEDTYYSEGVYSSGNELDLATPWTNPFNSVTTDYSHKWDNEEDTVVILPAGGTTATIDYGGAREVNAVTICQPRKNVYATLFVGTSEQATTIDTTITKADEGTEKTVGCCTYLVKEFGVTTSGASAMSVSVNPIVGNLVVAEIAATTAKNLIVVGGPAVNGLSMVTKEEIQAATGQYVVKKDGNKVYIAGWTASDTIDAGNALIAWLQANAHK
ncbi:MAG: hypothetical protein V1875_03695, partial [Candidatus Altiarchaeota archaeon]